MQRSRFKGLLAVTVFAFLSCSTIQAAQEKSGTEFQVSLEQLKKIKSTESQGDELYFSVTEYSSIERPRTYLLPNFPTHWLSEHLSEIKDLALWQKNIDKNESIMLVISLLERDAPPWNTDDLIGTLKLKIYHEDGQLKHVWQIPNHKEVEMTDKNKQQFIFSGDSGKYELDLKAFQVD